MLRKETGDLLRTCAKGPRGRAVNVNLCSIKPHPSSSIANVEHYLRGAFMCTLLFSTVELKDL